MKILHIGKYYPPFQGGIENFLADLAREQVSQGHEVRVLCHQHERGRPTETDPVDSGLEITRVAIMGVVAYAPITSGFFHILKDVLSFFKPDVVHVHMPNLSAFWLLFSRVPAKVVIHWHSDVVSSENDRKLRVLYPFYRIFEKRLLGKADRIIVTSHSYLSTSLALRRFRNKCMAVPLGLSLEKLKNFDRKGDGRVDSGKINEYSVPEDGFVLSVGRFTYYKGHKYLIKACQKGYARKLVIVGHGLLRPGLMELVRKLGLENRVFMPGKVDDDHLHRLFAQCTAFCLPSIERTEAFGMVLLEAMFHSKPLITTRVEGSGMNEVNIHNRTGLVVDPGDPDQLARAMNFMLDHKDEASRMGANGRLRLKQRFAISRVAREVEKIY
jgi:glycosyltransferase involved in cell wall biosynthesis